MGRGGRTVSEAVEPDTIGIGDQVWLRDHSKGPFVVRSINTPPGEVRPRASVVLLNGLSPRRKYGRYDGDPYGEWDVRVVCLTKAPPPESPWTPRAVCLAAALTCMAFSSVGLGPCCARGGASCSTPTP